MRYLAQFRDLGNDYYKTDCAWEEEERASSYVRRIVDSHALTPAGKVFDSETREVVYSYDRYNGEAA